ncbi:HlyD family efflux transporter periplasmic adaptor subunit [Pseudoalteromonas luteoviolacea]|uniref:efflux RND transporter periplasmic adaptor subunit n=1 Tax=Pseudoalteromonas luteoviolacea TaxID=43657 RepID=UPI001B3704B6|nr:HlyD family efflux transporter periplasmic adaptor subunit [Pseudoalteromonas luteoviolacea]MBQ4811634.1 HlyD family efflux transporter periplasmic adaptor subunit [Pseudoalteromonas luteoviolacea]
MIDGTQSQDELITPNKTKGKVKYALIALLMTVMTVVSIPAISQWYAGIKTVSYEQLLTAKVIRQDLIRDVSVSGRLVAANAPQIYSPEPGQVTLLVKPGDSVDKLSLIARIESPELDALIAQQMSLLAQLKLEADRGLLADDEAQLDLERSLDEATVRLNAAKREKLRSQESFEKQVISQLDYARSQDTLLEADLMYQHAQKRVELAKKRLTFEAQTRDFAVKRQTQILDELKRRKRALDVQAPVTGIVGNWLVQQKEEVADAQALMTIVDLSEYEAELNVPEFYADDLGIGLNVELTLAGQRLAGKVSSVSPEINQNQVAVRVKVSSHNGTKLRQNQRINGRIEFEKKPQVLQVKRGPFLNAYGGKKAFIIAENVADLREIKTGASSVEYIELTAGVEEGDEIIISDYEAFSQSQTFNIDK